jgi:hypothetical protein
VPRFDLAKTDQVVKLLDTPRDQRDDAWQDAFQEAIVDASMATAPEQVIQGPDGFGYFVLRRPPVGESFSAFCVSHVLETCTNRGLGIVIEPAGSSAEWVFTYGDLFSLRAYGSFRGDPSDADGPRAGPVAGVLEKETQVMVGAPSEQLLPAWARRVLASFLKTVAKVDDPRVLVLMESQRLGRNLVFNVYPEDFPSEQQYQGILNALGWFMPPNRRVIGMSRTAGLEKSFVPLVE